MSNDLISRSELLEELNSFSMGITGCPNSIVIKVVEEVKKSIANMIIEQPTAYDVDKVVEQIEGSLFAHTVNGIKFGEVGDGHQESVEDGIARGLRIAVTVVKGGLNK